ncbi:hypothetical protein [Heyndrickxia coagulans]|uniref:hypothetical protein n=1 Tax=Heyndrickxia coagulans TaxID=1398 RepID=UPI0005A0BDA9|nr:hypothetical protein [Heyndrickxia coagulans]
MLKNLSENSFATLRLPFESGKQSPMNIGLLNFFLLFIQALLMSPCQNAISPETVSSQTIKGR